tara:strand:+ start:378 stop:755 length:378 start_codon:yes stop_codon:yes gene_type:complete
MDEDDETHLLNDKIHLIDEFVQVMTPLVPSGKIGLEILNSPTRKKEKDITEHLITIAKDNKLHRKVKHAQCGVVVSFNEGINDLDGQFIQVHMSSMTRKDRIRRISIICLLIVMIVFLVKYENNS